jgi:uncharacterized protein DUF5681
MPATERTPQGRFPPGRSGNPAGRPPGARNTGTLAVEAALAARVEELVDALFAAVNAGKATALRIYFDRVAPRRNGRPVPVALPPVACHADMVEAARRIVVGMADGELTPDEAQDFFRVLEAFGRVLAFSARSEAPLADAAASRQPRAPAETCRPPESASSAIGENAGHGSAPEPAAATACRQPRAPAETCKSPESTGGADGEHAGHESAPEPAAAGPLPTGAGHAGSLGSLQKPANHPGLQERRCRRQKKCGGRRRAEADRQKRDRETGLGTPGTRAAGVTPRTL